jgi:lysophospholipase L1-like esterase
MKSALAALALAAVLAIPASATAAPAGNSIAALGDSITRAFDTCSIAYIDCPANSWSTGTSSAVQSWYTRLLATNPSIAGHNYNDAKTGAKMVDLQGQSSTAVSQQASIVTILMGANDVCTSSVSTMTPTTTLGNQLRAALTTLTSGDAGAQIYIAGIPNVYHLWEIFHLNLVANFVWSFAGICQSLLANPRSTAAADVQRRAQVANQVVADNITIASVCGEFPGNCHYDNGAAYRVAFTTSDVTTRDYFHPSVSGQAKAAAAIWAAFP